MKKYTKGITIIEVMVAVVIMSLFTSVGTSVYSDARANARDKTRIDDLAHIELALRLYVTDRGSEVLDCVNGIKIDGDTTSFVTLENGAPGGSCPEADNLMLFFENYFGSSGLPKDPSSDANHYYYFDNQHECTAVQGYYESVSMLFAVNMERMPSNVTDVCDAQVENDGGYVSIGGVASNPHVRVINFTSQVF